MATYTIRIWDSVKGEGFSKEVDESELVSIHLVHSNSNIIQARMIFDWCVENDIDANLVSGYDPGSGFRQVFYIEDASKRSFFTLRWC